MKREIEEILFKPIIVSIFDMDRFGQEKMMNKRPIKSTWNDWLNNYNSQLIRKIVAGFKHKVVSLFKTNIPQNYRKQNVYGRGKKLNKLEIQNQSEADIIENIRSLFKLKK